jgi:hypothetical protein
MRMIHTSGIIAGICFKSDPNCYRSIHWSTNYFLKNINIIDLHIVALYSANMGSFLGVEGLVSGRFEVSVKNCTHDAICICHLCIDKASIEFDTQNKRFKLIHITYETDICNIIPHLDKIIKNIGIVNNMTFYRK